MNRHSQSPDPVVLGLALLMGGCSGDGEGLLDPRHAGVEGIQTDGAWVFTYGRTPEVVMEALLGGPAAIVDGCLQVNDAVVIWHGHHLSSVNDVVSRLHDGRTVNVLVGGGGDSLDEGATIEDFPDEVLAHCSTSVIWYSGPEDITFDEES